MHERLYYLDNLRTFATILVILHHTAIAYGASGSWYYLDPGRDEISSILLTLFTAVNQSFFMGLFFFISGYFTPGSYDKKGALQFIKDRLKRLGIPLLAYVLVIGPVLQFFLRLDRNVSFSTFYFNKMSNLEIVWGPLWFVAALLYFSFAYVLWRKVRKTNPGSQTEKVFPTKKTIAFASLLVGIAAFTIRLLVPVGQVVLGQQVGYFSSYVFFFTAGILAYRHEWLHKLTKNVARFWFRISLVLIVALPLMFVIGGATEENETLFLGGLNLQALSYALWEPFVAFGIIMMLFVLFKEKLNKTSTFLSDTAGSAYTAYIIHAPLLVLISYSLRNIPIPSLLKFVCAGSLATGVTFLAARVILRLPMARKVL